MRSLNSLASVVLLVGCGRATNDLSSSVQRCELDTAADVCSAPAQAITASADEASATAVVAGVTYAIATPAGAKHGYVAFTASVTGTHTLYFGDAEPVRVCDETALCASQIKDCGELHRAAQYALVEGEIYVIELKPSAAKHPFRLHIVAPEPPPPPPNGLALAPAVFYPTTGTNSGHISVGDLNGDGAVDVVVSNESDAFPWVDIMRNDGTGAFVHAARVPASAPAQTVIADFDGDGDADVAGVGSDMRGPLPSFFLHNGGDFMFTKTEWRTTLQYRTPLWGGDFDEDGIVDLVIPYIPEGLEQRSGFVILHMPDLTVLQQQDDFSPGFVDAIAGDFNGDGHQDVIVGDARSPSVHLWLGDGSGRVTFAREIALPLTTGVDKLQPLDLDGNASIDFIAFASNSLGGAAIGLGSASDFTIEALPMASQGAATGDFDHDGRIDLIAGAPGLVTEDRPLNFYRGTTTGFVYTSDVPGALSTCCMAAADVNNDGLIDLVTNAGATATHAASISVNLGTP